MPKCIVIPFLDEERLHDLNLKMPALYWAEMDLDFEIAHEAMRKAEARIQPTELNRENLENMK